MANVTLWGASYSGVPAIVVPQTGGGSATFTDTSDADATAEDIQSGKTAYVNGVKITGTGQSGGVVVTETTDVGGGTIVEITATALRTQSKTFTPDETGATIEPDEGYNALSQVIVSAIPSNYVGSGVAQRTSSDLTASTLTVTAPSGYYASNATKTLSDANLAAGNIKSGTTIFGVTGTYTGGGSLSYDTKTVNAGSTYPVSLEFTSMKGEPKFFAVRLNAQVSSSGSTTYYYIVDIVSNCNGASAVTHGNCFRIGSTRRVDNITSGYSYSYSNSTLTITSSAASRSASPGAFYNGSYELIYAY